MNKTIAGIEIEMPPNTKLGSNVENCIYHLIRSKYGHAYYSLMGLRGRAKDYQSRYLRALRNVILFNPSLFEEGAFGPKGGFGAKYIG